MTIITIKIVQSIAVAETRLSWLLTYYFFANNL